MKFCNLLFLVMISSFTIQAQPLEKKGQGGKIKERIKAQRVAFISDRLALTSDEAQKFWPVYNQFTADFEEVKKAQNEQRKNTNDKLAVLGDKEIEKALEDELSSQQKLIELQRKYQIELKKVISVRKVAMLYKAERDFKLKLLKRMSESGQKMPSDAEEFN
jgi:hypothetical protein